MKKTLKLMTFLMIAAFGLMAWSCSDDDDDKVINVTELPSAATDFINKYYPSAKIMTVTRDEDHKVVEYDVVLNNGHEITFSEAGEWLDVDAPAMQTIPAGIAPEAIENYVATNYPNDGINEISKESYGYDVELVSTIDLRFAADGSFLGIDR